MSYERVKYDPGGPLVYNEDGQYKAYWNFGSRMISYEAGPRYNGSHCRWKRCSQINLARPSGSCATTIYRDWSGKIRTWICHGPVGRAPYGQQLTTVPPHNGAALQAAVANLHEKLDLNCNDRVMSYSYVLDLLPLLGPFLKASSILNKIGQWAVKAGRNLRSRPFTTILQDAAKADLLNRFVIQTTIQDTKNILDVYDRCVRAFTSANRRNMEATVLTGTNFQGTTGNWFTAKYGLPQNSQANGSVQCRLRQGTTAKVVAVMRLFYNTQQADPARWVAHALGIDTPLESIWDKIPFSFVVDYFFRVGEFIDTIGQRYGQDALRAKVLDVSECWALLKTQNVYEWIPGEKPWMSSSHGTILSFKGSSGSCGSTRFDRFPIAFLDSSGFWDKGGFWSPSLSSVRKRTLLELYLTGRKGRS